MMRVTLHRRPARLLAIGLAAVLAIAGLAAASAAASETQSAWNDRVNASAAVTAGTWQVPPPEPLPSSCIAMTPQGTPLAGGQCAVTGVTFNQWDNGVYKIRDYRISMKTNADPGYTVFDVDLASAAGAGAWSWAKAGTLATGHFTPSPGYMCAELPRLRASSPMNWGPTPEIWVRVIEDRTMVGPSSLNCG